MEKKLKRLLGCELEWAEMYDFRNVVLNTKENLVIISPLKLSGQIVNIAGNIEANGEIKKIEFDEQTNKLHIKTDIDYLDVQWDCQVRIEIEE